jgi:hypothetical protein
MFPLDFVNTSQDWLILQISLASLRVAHMASHWRMTIDAAKFNNMFGLPRVNVSKTIVMSFICSREVQPKLAFY